MNLYLIEFYTVDDDINFAWVTAPTKASAIKVIGLHESFSEVIQINEQYEVFELSGVTNPLHLEVDR